MIISDFVSSSLFFRVVLSVCVSVLDLFFFAFSVFASFNLSLF